MSATVTIPTEGLTEPSILRLAAGDIERQGTGFGKLPHSLPDTLRTLADAMEPPEPEPYELPVGTIVLDKNGDAWQRHSDGKWCAAGGSDGETLAYLADKYGPLTVIHTPEQPELEIEDGWWLASATECPSHIRAMRCDRGEWRHPSGDSTRIGWTPIARLTPEQVEAHQEKP